MNEKPETPEQKLEHLFEELKTAAESELEAERIRITEEFTRAHNGGQYVDGFSPAITRMIHNLPSATNKGSNLGVFFNMLSQGKKSCRGSVMWAAVLGAAYQLVTGLPQVLAAPESERLGALLKLIKDVVIVAGASGLTLYAARQLQKFLVKNAQRMLSVVCNKEAAEAFLFKAIGSGLKLPAACATLAAVGMGALTALYYAATSAWAKYNGDHNASEMEWEKMWKVLSLDNCIRTAISVIGGAMAVSLAPALGTGFFSFLVPAVLYFLCEWIVEVAIIRKEQYGGWSHWLASCFIAPRQPMMWAGGDFSDFESRMPEDLVCLISHTIVVDPVRSLRTGHLYEREQLYKWLRDRHTDPLTRERASSLDYIASPCAAKHAKALATLLNAKPVPLL